MRRLLLALGAIVFAAGCSSQGIYAVPLPGGADLGDNPMHLQIDFRDVLDLVPQSALKVDGVPVGRVSDIALAPDGWTASVNVLVNDDVDLPANAHAEVAQTNLLGEKFIALSAPPNPVPQRLADGAHIPVEDTRSATEIEQVLGALSLLLNGGGVAQLQPIITELNKSLEGRTPEVRSLLEQSDRLVSGLEEQVDSITRALDGLDALSDRVAAQNDQIAAILDELPEGITILNEQRPQFVEMLARLDRLGQVGYDVVTASRDNLINDLLALEPTLQALGAAAPNLVTSLPLIPTYPFPDSTLPGAIGGQVNTWLSLDIQIGTTLSNLGVGKPDPVYVPPVGRPVPVNPSNPYYNGNGPYPGWPTVSLLPLPPITPSPTAGQDPLGAMLDQLGLGGGAR